MTIKRKFDQIEECIRDNYENLEMELFSHFSKKLCIEEIHDTEYIEDSKNYLINVLKEQTIESIAIIHNDMGSKEHLKSVYDRYINILDKLEIYNTDITLEIIKFFELYSIWIDTLKISDICTSREIMCRLFSIILNIDTYFINYYFV